MFKKKGSSTNVAIVCSLICAALGVYYGLSSTNSAPPPPDRFTGEVQQNRLKPVGNAAVFERVDSDGPEATSSAAPPETKGRSVVFAGKRIEHFARPNGGMSRFVRIPGGVAGTAAFARPASTPAASSSHAGTAAAAVEF